MCIAKDDFSHQVTLSLPDGIDPIKEVRSISCDRCCVDLMKHLWSKGILTLSHCCGHGKRKPSIVISEAYPITTIPIIESYIREVDKRDWDILQWCLIKMN